MANKNIMHTKGEHFDHVTEITKCRVCGHEPLVGVLSMGNLCVTNFLESETADQARAPLDLVLCDKSGGGVAFYN